MWIDERGSQVLDLAECRRLLALGAKEGLVGHLGIDQPGAPLIVPVDYAVHGPDLVVRIGEGLSERVRDHPLVAVEVEGLGPPSAWSVLVRGEAIEVTESWLGEESGALPRVPLPGHRIVRIRADVVTGRRLGRPTAGPGPALRAAPTRRTAPDLRWSGPASIR